MKIRICDDSIRLRLDRSEVEAIGRNDTVECHTHFPGGREFTYRLTVAETNKVAASIAGSCIEVCLPKGVAASWAGDETEVSIEAVESLARGELVLLVEKDFECLEPREGEDQSNRFENPKAIA